MNKPLRCCSCNKVLADEVSVQAGTIRITCRCGVVNEVKANLKETVPYGERIEMVQKEGGFMGRRPLRHEQERDFRRCSRENDTAEVPKSKDYF